MIISNILVNKPYNILSFLYSGENDQGFSFEYTYEVHPAYKSSEGVWVNTSENMFIEEDLKLLITEYKILWTEEIINEYTAYMDSLIPDNPALQQQLDEILASL